jgi:hypothetical protein
MEERFIGRSDFVFSRERKQFFYIRPIGERNLELDFNVDEHPQRYINEMVSGKNTMEI